MTDVGTNPKSYQLDFPTGIVMDPAGRYVFVNNGNADLSYGGGTIEVVDTLGFECAISWYKVDKYHFPTVPNACNTDSLHAQAVKDYVKGMCQLDPDDQSIVDCDETPFILSNSTVKIGNFAGEIRLQRFYDSMGNLDQFHRRLFMTVRGDPSITWADIHFPNPAEPSPVPKNINAPGIIQCVDNPQQLLTNPGYNANATGLQTTSPLGCDQDHVIQQYVCAGLPSCLAGMYNDGTTQLSTEPFGIQIDQSAMGAANPYSRLLVSHQASGQVSLIDLYDNGTSMKPQLIFTSNPFFSPDSAGNHGAFGMAQQYLHDPTSPWYLTSNLQAQLATFRIAQANVIVPESSISLQATYAFGNDIRDIQFTPDGNEAFITENNPPSLITFDTRVQPGPNGGLPNDAVLSNIDVCQTPSHFQVRRFYEQGAPGTPTQLRTRIYVVCFLSSQVMIVDPDIPQVLDTIFSGIGGPNQIAFNFSSDDAAPEDVITSTLPPRGYVTNFSESTIAVIDLEQGSATQNHVLGRLGLPPDGIQP